MMEHPFYKHVRKTATTSQTFFMSHLGFSGTERGAILSDFLSMGQMQVEKIIFENEDFNENETKNELKGLMQKRILQEMVRTIEKVGDQATIDCYKGIKRFLYNNFGFIFRLNPKNAEKLTDRILEISEDIIFSNGKSSANFIIVPSFIESILNTSFDFKPSDIWFTKKRNSVLGKIGTIGKMEVFVFDDPDFNDKILIGASFENSSMLDKIVYVEGTEEFLNVSSLQGPDATIPHRIYVHTKNVCIAALTQSEKCFRTLHIKNLK